MPAGVARRRTRWSGCWTSAERFPASSPPRRGPPCGCRCCCLRCARAVRRGAEIPRAPAPPLRAPLAAALPRRRGDAGSGHAAARVVAPDDTAALVAAALRGPAVAVAGAARRTRPGRKPRAARPRLARRARPRRGARRPARRLLPRHAAGRGDRRARLAGSRPAAEEAPVVHDAARDARALRAVARRRSRRDDVGGRRAVHRPVRAHAGARVVRPRRALAVSQRGAPARAGARAGRGRRPRRPLRGRAAGARGRPRAAAPAALLRRPARGGADLRDGPARRRRDPRRLGLREPARRAPHPDSPAALRAPDQPVARQPAALVEPRRALVLRARRAVAPAVAVRQGRSHRALVGPARAGAARGPASAGRSWRSCATSTASWRSPTPTSA